MVTPHLGTNFLKKKFEMCSTHLYIYIYEMVSFLFKILNIYKNLELMSYII
jgi:hypothetical protein